MSTKRSRWLSGVVAVSISFVLFTFLTAVRADAADGPPSVLVLALDPAAAESGSDPATFLIVRTGSAGAPLTVNYVLGGTATNGVDYDLLPGSVTIPVGAYFASVVVSPINDYLVEGTESVVIALQQPAVWPPPYIVTWPSVAFAEIADDDRAPTNTPPTVSIVQPADGAIFDRYDDIQLVARAFDKDGRVITVEFFDGTNSLGVVTNRPVLVPIDRLGAGDDPTFGLNADLFPDLDAATDITAIPIRGNLFRLLWTDPPAGHHVLTAVATDDDGDKTRSAPVEIKVLEAPPLPILSVRATDAVATEPDPTTDYLDTATFTIHRTGPTNLSLPVFYRLGGTASNGVDYRELPHRTEIPAGARNVSVVVQPLDDLLIEGPETVVLSLVTPVSDDALSPSADTYFMGRAHTARAVILDNDIPPNHPPLVRLVKPEDGSVFLAPADIRLAALARDFDGEVTTVEFFEGTNSLGIVTNNPASLTPVRLPFSLVWSNVPPGHYVLTALATDNDGASTQSEPVEIKVVPRLIPPEVNILTTDAEAAEPGMSSSAVLNTATFSVLRTGGTDLPLTVFYSIGGSASNGIDYHLLSGRVIIPAGASSNSIVIEPIDDQLVEGIETVGLKIEPPPFLSPANPVAAWWYRIGSNSAARAFIRDNDTSPTNLPPRVALVSPDDGEVFCAPADIKLVAVAKDADGWVRTVEFFDGDHSLGTVTNSLTSAIGIGSGGIDPGGVSPEQFFRLAWLNAPPGMHVLTAKATDNRGASSSSEPVRIKVLPSVRPPVVTIVATDPYASEGNWFEPVPVDSRSLAPISIRPQTATFTVSRNGNVENDLTVFYKLDGTAENGVDYRALSGQVIIPRGSSKAEIVVEPIDDQLPEPTETVIVALVPVLCDSTASSFSGCYSVGDPHRAVASIFDNDINQSPKLEIVHPSDGDVFRAYMDIEIDVVTSDPDGWVSKMEFFANDKKIGEQQIFFIIAPPPGQVQKFSMVWSNVPPGAYSLTARATDNDGARSASDPVNIKVSPLTSIPEVTIEAVDPVATEPNPLVDILPDTAKFKVSRTGDLSQALTVLYRIGGTASNGVDYQKIPDEITIPMNAATALIVVEPLDDSLVEGTESVVLSLVQPPCVTSNVVTAGCYLVAQPGRAIAYIRDNDSPPNKPPTVSIVSPANGAIFCAPVNVRLAAAANDPDGWVARVEFFDGTNSIGTVSNNVWIIDAPALRLPDLPIAALPNDTLARPFSLVWLNVPPGKHVLTAVATDNTGDSTRSRSIEIAVNKPVEPPVINIMAVDPVAREGTTNTATFRVRRVGSTNSSLTVYYTIHGTASNGVDYVTIPGWVTIPAGRHGAQIVISPIDDKLPERVETVLLRLITPPVGPTTYEIGRPARAGAIILDNDHPLLATSPLPDGCLNMQLPVPRGMPYRLEASNNLLDWEAVVCGTALEDNLWFVDDDKEEHPHRFFRVIQEFGDVDDD